MTTKEIEDELYRMLSDVVNGGYPKRTYAQKARYKEAVKRTIDALDILEQMSHSEKPNKWINKPQESENEKVIRISKGTLKARTGKYVIYDVEWLKEHFNTTEAKIYGQSNGDCISRKEAIDALKQQAENMLCWSERYAEQRKGILTAINIVSDLLSVTPQSKAEALQEHQHYKDLAESYEKTINKLTKAIAEPQQKTGHWFLSGGYWRCSECKEKALLKLDKATGGYREYEPVRSKYCPNCGAKMQEVKK